MARIMQPAISVPDRRYQLAIDSVAKPFVLRSNNAMIRYAVTKRVFMATSNAERQAAYRAKHLKSVDGQGERLNLVVGISAKRALERLASCYGVTQRAMIEKLLRDAERQAANAAAAVSGGDAGYYDKTIKLDVTA